MSHSQMKPEAAKQYSNAVQTKKYDLAVIIGRFEPFHVGHSVLINQGLAVANHILVLVGSSNTPRTIKNPFTYEERSKMIRSSLSVSESSRLHVMPLPDNLYSDDEWVKTVQNRIEAVHNAMVVGAPKSLSTCIVGNKKDESSYYLNMFPQYGYVAVDEVKLGLDATMLRTLIFETPDQVHLIKSLVPSPVFSIVEQFMKTEEYSRLVREYEMVKKYKESWGNSPYPPVFVTVDAVVKKSGHILLVRRKAAPGEGLLALPGGFVNQNERLKDAAIRELIEETNIDLPPGLLANSISDSSVFDHPGRSLRGRTITHAFFFDLDKADRKSGLPKVKGGDDASDAMWIPISKAIEKATETYEDHLSIWRSFIGV